MPIRPSATWFCLLLLGCTSNPKPTDFMPAQDKARTAVTAALDAWKAGKKAGLVESATPQVEVIDGKWKAGQKLAGYEIVAVEAGTGKARVKVRLTMEKPAGNHEITYFVYGNDPVWVHREEDYKREYPGG